jgi:predicted RNA-binding Zn-ribbon protein involved in translation (DUF1610 family)
MSEQLIKDIFEKLQNLTNVDDAVKQDHIADIKKKYDKSGTSQEEPAAAPNDLPPVETPEPDMTANSTNEPIVTSSAAKEIAPEQEELKCPRCGNALVLRQAKKGPNAGNSFYGCSAFPKCRYIKNIE